VSDLVGKYDYDDNPELYERQLHEAARKLDRLNIHRGKRVTRTALGMMLDDGHWFQWSLGSQLPDTVKVHRGSVHNPMVVAFISRQQALALIRWHYTPGVYYSYLTMSGKWHDVRVCGDIDAWYGDEWLLIQKHKAETED